jgi:uncharacterized lipoprotein YmbA
MIARCFVFRRHWHLLLWTLLLGACLGPANTTTLHTLQPVRQQPLALDWNTVHDLTLLMPVQLAPHLQVRGLLNQQAPGEARASATHLWAGPLEQQVSQQIVAGLKDLLATENIAAFPGPRFGAIRYQIEVELNEFSGNGQQFTTTAVYTLSDTVAKTILARKTFRQDRPIDKPEHSSYVTSASQAIADLSKEIAAALLAARRMQPDPRSRP